MGERRTGDRPLGVAAVTPAGRAAGLLASLLMLGGCKAVPEIAGVVSGGIAGGASGNPAVGFAVGVAADAAITAGQRYYGRSRQHHEQEAIARVAGALPEGVRAPWRIDHTIPIGDEHGQLQVVRAYETPLTACKEIAFSVETDGAKEAPAWYIAEICREAASWHWAGAEPAVPRWGFLQ